MTKHFFCDIDGTLFQDNKIEPKVLEAVVKFISQGNKFYLATGRIDSDVLYLLDNKIKIQSDFRVSQNGTVITDSKNNLIYSKVIDFDILPQIISFIKNLNTEQLIIEASDLTNRHLIKPRPVGYGSEFNDIAIVNHNMLNEIGVSIFPTIILIYSKNYDYLIQIQKQIHSIFNNHITAVMTSDYTLELLSSNHSKATAIKYVAKLLNIKDEDIIVAGDNENDVDMFKKFYNNSFCMIKAKPHVKNKAKYIASNVEEVINMLMKV
jgi:Cof subfamily protein (haloacid dehalogenase superfamily)